MFRDRITAALAATLLGLAAGCTPSNRPTDIDTGLALPASSARTLASPPSPQAAPRKNFLSAVLAGIEGVTPDAPVPSDFYALIDASQSMDERRAPVWWADLTERLIAWYLQAPPTSRAEVYYTSPRYAWDPVPLLEVEVPARHGGEKARAAKALRARLTALARQEITRKVAHAASPLLEDSRRLLSRAALRGKPYSLVLITDAQQKGPVLQFGQILATADESALLRAVVAKTGGKLRPPPAQVTLVYVPSGGGAGAALPAPDEKKLLDFYGRVFTGGWGAARVATVEPSRLAAAR